MKLKPIGIMPSWFRQHTVPVREHSVIPPAPEFVAGVKFLTWTDDNLLRQVVYQGLREDKPAAEVRRPVPHSPAAVNRAGSNS